MIGQSKLSSGDLVRPYWTPELYIVIEVFCRLVAGKRKSYCRVTNGHWHFSFKECEYILVRKAEKNDLAK